MIGRLVTLCRVALVVGLAALVACAASAQTLTISAAASLSDAMSKLADEFETEHPGLQVELNLAASGLLAAQIRQGAPADVFVSASLVMMDDLQREGLIERGTRRDMAANRLVLIAPHDDTTYYDLSELPASEHLAIGNPQLVPAGTYARQSLESMNLWDELEEQLVFGESVRQVLAWVETGEVALGIVYATDAQISQRVRVLEELPSDTHQPIRYSIAIIEASDSSQLAQDFLDFVSGPRGQAILTRHGFELPDEAQT